jgi:hypothetical protein
MESRVSQAARMDNLNDGVHGAGESPQIDHDVEPDTFTCVSI